MNNEALMTDSSFSNDSVNDSFSAYSQEGFEDARKFLRLLDPSGDGMEMFQTFSDVGGLPENEKKALARSIYCSFEQIVSELSSLNRRGAGIFVTINRTDGVARTKKNIRQIRAVFADNDNGNFDAFPLKPSAIVQTKNGQHAYWFLKENISDEQFKRTQKSIASILGTDPSINDTPRVMRLPGFFHKKDPQDPFMVTLVESTDQRFSISEILNAFPDPSGPDGKRRIKIQRQAIVHKVDNKQHFVSWCAKQATEAGSENPNGGRNNTLLLMIREGLGLGVEPETILKVCQKYCDDSDFPVSDLEAMFLRQSFLHADSPFKPFFIGVSMEQTSYHTLAMRFLELRRYNLEGRDRLRYWRDEFYVHTGTHYKKRSDCELEAEIMQYLQQIEYEDYSPCTRKTVNEVLENLKGIVLVPESTCLPSFIGGKEGSSKNLVVLKNGIFDVDKYILGAKDVLSPHDPSLFTLSCLPFEFFGEAVCERWNQFLSEALPDVQIRNFLQEWFGYNLVFDSSHHKFVLLVGSGANGKTVVCTVLRTLLGPENVSAVGLEQLNAQRTFPIAAMVGKLANIVEEVSDFEKASEGILKDIVSGGVLTIERKNRDPFNDTASVRMTFATNLVPRFKDRSEGLWRRLVPIQFLNQILDPAKQDRRLVDPTWWIESGEIEGVFLWALEGLRRLRTFGRFTQCESVDQMRAELKEESNPAGIFLKDNCKVVQGMNLPTTELYRTYQSWAQAEGVVTLGRVNFNSEVKNCFGVRVSKNPITFGEFRSRYWIDLDWIDCSGKR